LEGEPIFEEENFGVKNCKSVEVHSIRAIVEESVRVGIAQTTLRVAKPDIPSSRSMN
jgi:hypothetical protein